MTSNERKTYDRLFQQEMVPHMDLLYHFALRTTGSADDAKDLLQETYLKAYRFIDKYEQGTNAKAWLFRIMKNSFINNYRKNSRTPEQVDYDTIEDYYDLVRDQTADGNDMRKQFYNDLLEDEVVQAMDSITEEFRTIIILSDLEGLTYEEISEMLDIPLGTVRSRLHRARKNLQGKLKKFALAKGYLSKELRAAVSASSEEEEESSVYSFA
ncbi:MAG TPA: sigma-70 family RNA polymerase sigma factor [Bacteroidota bacterium]|nr:sigma-70 family RNA polymerase sigma factor [Bacteroidota bacterium]